MGNFIYVYDINTTTFLIRIEIYHQFILHWPVYFIASEYICVRFIAFVL